MAVAVVSELLAPLEVVEQIATANDWEIDRGKTDDTVIMFVEGRCSEYEVAFTWFESTQLLHVACGFDLKVPKNRQKELDKLIKILNQEQWLGHFDYWEEAGMVLLRHCILRAPEEELTAKQVFGVLERVLNVSEDNVSAFMFVVDDNMKANAALELNITTTEGTA